jgi:hypothetical protein
MPRIRLATTVGVERFEGVGAFADADKAHGLADDRLDRERRAAARVAVHLAHNDARQFQPLVERFRDINRLLPRGGVYHQQHFVGLQRGVHPLQLVHQRLVYL